MVLRTLPYKILYAVVNAVLHVMFYTVYINIVYFPNTKMHS